MAKANHRIRANVSQRKLSDFPITIFADPNLPAVPLILDLARVGLELGRDAKGHYWLQRRKEVRRG